MKDEKLLVVKRCSILSDDAFQGFSPLLGIPFEDITPYIEVKNRVDMETDPKYKQLVSYIMCRNLNGELLAYERLSGGGEDRLHGQLSIGIGGHMNPDNEKPSQILERNALRELEEECSVVPYELEKVGYINDDSNDVGKVHLGVVYEAYIPEDIHITETDTLRVFWTRLDHIDVDRLEPWSKILVEQLKKREL